MDCWTNLGIDRRGRVALRCLCSVSPYPPVSDQSKNEWTDAIWNPVRGCTKISPGCKFCYGERFAERFRGVVGHPYEQGFDIRLVPERLTQPWHWLHRRMISVGNNEISNNVVNDAYCGVAFVSTSHVLDGEYFNVLYPELLSNAQNGPLPIEPPLP
jgi:Protein of unknown function (DUF5131)